MLCSDLHDFLCKTHTCTSTNFLTFDLLYRLRPKIKRAKFQANIVCFVNGAATCKTRSSYKYHSMGVMLGLRFLKKYINRPRDNGVKHIILCAVDILEQLK
jgi:hypothetical protein